MGKKVLDGDYAKPLFSRLYRADRQMLDELVESFPAILIKQPRKGGQIDRKITDTEVVRMAIAFLHSQRFGNKKYITNLKKKNERRKRKA